MDNFKIFHLLNIYLYFEENITFFGVGKVTGKFGSQKIGSIFLNILSLIREIKILKETAIELTALE